MDRTTNLKQFEAPLPGSGLLILEWYLILYRSCEGLAWAVSFCWLVRVESGIRDRVIAWA